MTGTNLVPSAQTFFWDEINKLDISSTVFIFCRALFPVFVVMIPNLRSLTFLLM